MSDWFFMLGEPITEVDRVRVREYLKGLGVEEEYPIEGVSSWADARTAITSSEWEQSIWQAERREAGQLRAAANAKHGELGVLETLSSVVSASDAAHGAAAVAAARIGCTDFGVIGSAAGAASEALYMAALADLAGRTDEHPFIARRALFAGGHWPLGVTSGRYYIF